MQMLRQLEPFLLTGQMHDVVQQYPEINQEIPKVRFSLFKGEVQLPVYYWHCYCPSRDDHRGLSSLKTSRNSCTPPSVSSAEPKRSFGSLNKLKTWLCSSITQTHLNSVAVCHEHNDKLDRVNRKRIVEWCVSCQEGRQHFSSFK